MSVAKKRDLSHLTEEDIRADAAQGKSYVSNTIKPVLTWYRNYNIIRFRRLNHKALKSGTKLRRESEIAALRLTAQLELPTLRVLGVSEGMSDGEIQIEIHMSFIQGQTLDSIWPTLSPPEKRAICHQLRHILNTMRQAT
jgi:hypothetical protein